MAQTAIKPDDQLLAMPDGSKVLYRDSSHRYWSPSETLDELPTPGAKVTTTPLTGVTTVTGCLDKPALLPWVEEQTCEAIQALAAQQIVIPVSAPDLLAALSEAQLGWRYTRDRRATSGTSVHAALERLATTGSLPPMADFPVEDHGYVQGLAAFWLDARPGVEATEVVVASQAHGLAGRFDLLASVTGARLVVDSDTGAREAFTGRFRWDAKTSRAIYATENFAQLAGYDLLADQCGHDPVDGSLVLRLDQSGAYEVALSTATHEDFLAILGAYETGKRLAASRPRRRKPKVSPTATDLEPELELGAVPA